MNSPQTKPSTQRPKCPLESKMGSMADVNSFKNKSVSKQVVNQIYSKQKSNAVANPIKQKDFQQKIKLLLIIVNNQPYMDYKHYLIVKQFFLKNLPLFRNLKQGHNWPKKSTSQSPPISTPFSSPCSLGSPYNSTNNSLCLSKSPSQSLSPFNLYHIAFVSAKAFYLQHQYRNTIKILQEFLSIENTKYFKFVYQRQVLMIKAIYLAWVEDDDEDEAAQKTKEQQKGQGGIVQKLKSACLDYFKARKHCVDWQHVKDNYALYDRIVENLFKSVVDAVKSANNIQITEQIQKELKLFCNSASSSKIRIFQGIPVYLISTSWLTKLKKFLQNPQSNLFPGPVMNFQLENHLFQFQRHIHLNKSYMDTFLFPVTEEIDYVLVKKKQWKNIFSLIGGMPIKRFPIMDKKFTDKQTTDTLTKIILQADGQTFFMQWQTGIFWQFSILPYINDQLFGSGQLKQIQLKQNSNHELYTQISVVNPGALKYTYSRYKFIAFSVALKSKLSASILNKLQLRYNLQQYKLPSSHQLIQKNEYEDQNKKQNQAQFQSQNQFNNHLFPECFHRKPSILGTKQHVLYYLNSKKNPLLPLLGLRQKFQPNSNLTMHKNKDQLKSQQKLTELKKYSQSIIKYLDIVVCFLGGIAQFAQYFVTNAFVADLRLDYSSEQIELCFALADTLKRLWFSNYKQDSISAQLLIQDLLKIKSKQLLQSQSVSPCPTTLATFLYSMLILLHNQLSPNPPLSTFSTMPPQSYPSHSSSLESLRLALNKQQNSFIWNLFRIYQAKGLYCNKCDKNQYKLEGKIGMDLQMVLQGDIVKAFFVMDIFVKKEIGGQSFREIMETETSSIQSYTIKKVQQILFKIRKNKTISHIYQLLGFKFNLNLQDPNNQLVSIVVDEQMQQCHQIYSTEDLQYRNISFKWLNSILDPSSSSSKKFLFFTFITPKPSQFQHLCLVSFRNGKTNRICAFPILIKLHKKYTSYQQGQPYQQNKKFIERVLCQHGCHKIHIDKYIVKNRFGAVNKQQFKQKKLAISVWIQVYADGKVGAQRALNRIVIDDAQNQAEKLNEGIDLQECIQNQYCTYSNEQPKQPFQQPQQQQSPIISSSSLLPPLVLPKSLCQKCRTPLISTSRLLQLSRYLLVSTAPSSSSFSSTPLSYPRVRYPFNLNMRPFMPQRKKKNYIYALRGVIERKIMGNQRIGGYQWRGIQKSDENLVDRQKDEKEDRRNGVVEMLVYEKIST